MPDKTTDQKSKEDDYQFLMNILRQASDRSYYGSVTLKFEAGKLVHIVKEESFKPPSLKKPA